MFGYSPEDFATLDEFLMDLHSRSPATSMSDVLRTANQLLLKLKNIEQAYRWLGDGAQQDDFKQILFKLSAMKSAIITWRLVAAGHLSILTGGLPPSALDTTAVVKDAVKLYDFVKWYALSQEYRIGGGVDPLVYVQDRHMWEGQLHKTPHWRHVIRMPQPGENAQMTAVDLIDECYKVNRLGEDMVNINTSDEVKKACATRMAKNDEDLQLMPLSRHLHSFANGLSPTPQDPA